MPLLGFCRRSRLRWSHFSRDMSRSVRFALCAGQWRELAARARCHGLRQRVLQAMPALGEVDQREGELGVRCTDWDFAGVCGKLGRSAVGTLAFAASLVYDAPLGILQAFAASLVAAQ